MLYNPVKVRSSPRLRKKLLKASLDSRSSSQPAASQAEPSRAEPNQTWEKFLCFLCESSLDGTAQCSAFSHSGHKWIMWFIRGKQKSRDLGSLHLLQSIWEVNSHLNGIFQETREHTVIHGVRGEFSSRRVLSSYRRTSPNIKYSCDSI